jgi:gas vesicle protein
MATDRIEQAIEKLTSISSDLKSMIAVHEQRISQQEKMSDELHDTVEKRREELDTKLKDVYNTMREQDNNVLQHIESLRAESAEQHKNLSEKINKLEKYIWLAIGGGITASWVISLLLNHYKSFLG